VIRRLRWALPVLFLGSALALVPWIGWLALSLPCRYVSRHWGIAWAGFDAGLALALGLTGLAALRRSSWLDRGAVAAATLLGADAWFDVVTSRGASDMAVATAEALAIELPLPGVERSFTSFSAAATEASLSRIYAGQHFRFDLVAGQRLGRQVADYALANFLTPREPAKR
jgi:hypothetical protein